MLENAVLTFGVSFRYQLANPLDHLQRVFLEYFKILTEKNDEGYWKPFLFLVRGFSISFINAVMLSLNAFTTLGFGNIPTRGIARYMCVIQGFVGWFLLSLFTVALLGQL